MKSGTLLPPDRPLPDRLRSAIRSRFPGKTTDDLIIRYHETGTTGVWEM